MAEGPAYHIQHTTSLEAAGFGNPQSQLISDLQLKSALYGVNGLR